MNLSKAQGLLSYVTSFLLLIVSTAGIFNSNTYAKETINWAEQGIGQDYVNLFVVAPLLLLATYLMTKGSFRAFFIWLGTLLYIFYSYLLYAFFIHFSILFLPYITLVGLSFYLFIFGISEVDYHQVARNFNEATTRQIIYLFYFVVFIFSFLWLSDIIKNLYAGTVPMSIIDAGLTVNPVYVLDLALFLPGVFIVARLLKKRNAIGFMLAVPLMTFLTLMSLAIISMLFVTSHGNYQTSMPIMVFMFVVIFLCSFLSYKYLKTKSIDKY